MTTPIRKILAATAITGMSNKERETLIAHFDTKKLHAAIEKANTDMRALGSDGVLAETIEVLRENFPEAAKPYVQ